MHHDVFATLGNCFTFHILFTRSLTHYNHRLDRYCEATVITCRGHEH